MSLLTFFFLWVVGSCVATPLIGVLLFRALDSRSKYRSSNRFIDSKPAPNQDSIVAPAPSALPVSRAQRRRPAVSALNQRISGRSRR